MRSFIAALRTLVLPYGTTTGARIELDGVNGEIRIYDVNNFLVCEIDSDGIFLSPDLDDFDAPGVFLEPDIAAMILYPDATGTGESYSAGRVSTGHYGSTGFSPYTWITSPAIFPVAAGDRVEMLLIGAGGTGETPGIQINGCDTFNLGPGEDTQMIVSGRVTVHGHDIGRGYRDSATNTASTGALAADTVVLTISNFTFEAGRAYRMTMVSGLSTSADGIYSDMRIRKTNTAGAVIAEYYRYRGNGGNVVAMDGIKYCRNNTGADIVTDVVLCMNRVGAAGTVTQFASAQTPRSFIIEDCGTSADYAFAGTV